MQPSCLDQTGIETINREYEKIGFMEPVRSQIVSQTLLSRSPRKYSLEVMLISVLVLLLSSWLAWQDPMGPTGYAAVPERVFSQGEYWRLLTAAGVHSDLQHLLANLFFFALFSFLLHGYFGFWVYPTMVLLLACLTHFVSLLTYPPETHLVGASGVVYLMAGFWLTMHLLVERRHSLAKRWLRTLGVALLVFVPSSLHERVSYRTHAIGFVVGVAFALAYFQAHREEIREAEVVEDEEALSH